MTNFLGLDVSQLPATHKLCYLSGCSFQRDGPAFDYKGREVLPDTPRMVHMRNGELINALLLEEEHTNLLTANQSTGTDTLGTTTGFGIWNSNTSTISSSTDTAHTGSRSLKCVTKNNTIQEGLQIAQVPVSESAQCVFQFHHKIPDKKTIRMGWFDNTWTNLGTVDIIGTGKWEYKTVLMSAKVGESVISIAMYTIAKSETKFYVDTLQLIEKPYPLSWTLGGTTQPAETLQLPGHTVNPMSGTVEVEAYIEPEHKGRAWELFNYNDIITILHTEDGKLQLKIGGGHGMPHTTSGILDSELLDGFNHITARFAGSGKGIITLNGDVDNQFTVSIPTPIPSYEGDIQIGNGFNGLIRNIHISNISRSDEDVEARVAGSGFPVDEHCSLVYPLLSDLDAYRVVER